VREIERVTELMLSECFAELSEGRMIRSEFCYPNPADPVHTDSDSGTESYS
jgi:hypothetical protein